MTRWAFVAAASVALGCAPAGTPETAPAPETEPLVVRAIDPASEAVSRWDAPPPVPEVLARLAADSARDAEVLERLHDVESPEADVVPAEFDLESGFDINVARYAEHPRVQYYLRYFQGPARERMGVWLTRLPYYEPMIRSVLAANGLPGDLVYLALIESGYSNTAVSRSRAVGMWQFMRATGREYGLRADSWVDERRDFIKATNAAARYLSDLTNRLGSHYLAAAAYNGGPGTVLRGLRRIGDAPVPDDVEEQAEGELIETVVLDDQFFRLHDSSYLRRETKDYVPKLIAAAMIAKQPEKYGFGPIPTVEPFNVDSVPVTEPTSLETVAKVSGTPLEDIVRLNAHFLRRVTPPVQLTWVRVPFGKGVSTTEALAALPADERIPVVMHTIRPGETLTSIGRKYGVSAGSLAEFNGGISSRGLKAGASLRVPKGVGGMEEPSEVRRSASGVHVVRRGETLGAISREYGVSVARLRSLNGLGSSNLIKVGQRLKVEGTSSSRSASASSGGRARTHLVRKGDTLSELAERYGVSVRQLMQANNLRSAQSLKAGARITIPS